jgi:hypothetical protein
MGILFGNDGFKDPVVPVADEEGPLFPEKKFLQLPGEGSFRVSFHGVL